MPTEFQKAMTKELADIPNTCAVLDDLLIVAKISRERHFNSVKQVKKRLNNANIGPTWEKCRSGETESD